jgi:hypothetical protein
MEEQQSAECRLTRAPLPSTFPGTGTVAGALTWWPLAGRTTVGVVAGADAAVAAVWPVEEDGWREDGKRTASSASTPSASATGRDVTPASPEAAAAAAAALAARVIRRGCGLATVEAAAAAAEAAEAD